MAPGAQAQPARPKVSAVARASSRLGQGGSASSASSRPQARLQGLGLFDWALGFGQAQRLGQAHGGGAREAGGPDEGEQLQRVEQVARPGRRVLAQTPGGEAGMGHQGAALFESARGRPGARTARAAPVSASGDGALGPGQDHQGGGEIEGGGRAAFTPSR